jgi:NAD(P)-dependent dehydrogenase (short-subunit alcohol dehydrogenase family)
MPGLVADRRVIVTGGGRNLGREYCLALAKEGASIAVLDRDGAGAASVAAEVRALGGVALDLECDVTDDAAVRAAVAHTVEVLGGVDVLVNNAAVYDGLRPAGPAEVDLDEWDLVMSVNVKGVFICARAAAEAMQEAGTGGSIINISSGTALSGPAFLIHYAASKGAVLTLTKSLARAYGASNIRVNSLAPGVVWDQPSLDLVGSEEETQGIVNTQIFQRRAEPEDLVGTVVFLASDMSAWITGQTIAVNGGNNLH